MIEPSLKQDRAGEIPLWVERMRHGDREAAAEFITRYGTRIRRRIRGKLSPAVRRIFDSQDILATVGRRLDCYVRAGDLTVNDEEHFWALVLRMAHNAVIDKSRLVRRLRETEGPDGPLATEILGRLRRAREHGADGEDFEVEEALEALGDDVDREILTLWLLGFEHRRIGEQVGLPAATVRKRWQKIRNLLFQRFSGDNSR